MPDATIAGTSPCLLCPGEEHAFHYDRAGSYIIQCPKLAAASDHEALRQLVAVGPGQWVAITDAGRLYALTFRNPVEATLTPVKLTWLNVARPVG